MNKKQLTLSIVIPAYNEEHHLRTCLESIAAQTVMPEEVIVVDNNSDDKTAETAAAFPFVRVISERKPGIVHARNRGFDAARSDIISRIDADVILPPAWTERIKDFYSDPAHSRMAWSGPGFFYNVRLARLVAWTYRLLAFHFNRLILGHNMLWGSNTALPRSCWENVRQQICTDADIHEDLDLAMHLDRQGVAIQYDPATVVSAELRRVHDSRRELWNYLQWWPRTIQTHHKRSWIFCWLLGLLLYAGAFVLFCLGRAEELFGRSLFISLPQAQESPREAAPD